jgi:FtsH-binding integral membrane protein
MFNQQQAMPAYGAVAQEAGQVRLAFIRKVYSLLTATILVTMASVFFAIQSGLALNIVGTNPLLLLAGFFLVYFGVYMVRKVPVVNILALGALGVGMGIFISPTVYIANLVQPGTSSFMGLDGVVGQAFLLTTIVFTSLTAYVFITRQDFSWMGAGLFVGFFLLLGIMLVFIFFGIPAKWMYTAYLIFGLVLFIGFVLYDTSNIMHHLSSDEYVLGALHLFIDFVNLFLFILQLLMNRD